MAKQVDYININGEKYDVISPTLKAGLETKLTQPYVSNDLETHIVDSDNGLIRNMQIRGQSTQLQETGLVPTPERPIPLVSKKVKVGDEVVELRSLKESANLFDEKLTVNGYVGANPANEGGVEIASSIRKEIASDFISLNNNTKLSIWINTTPIGNNEQIWYGIGFYDSNKNYISRITGTSSITTENTTIAHIINVPTNAKYFRFSYRKYDDGKAVVMLSDQYITSYVAPTVRDYLIVDDTNKTISVERNVGIGEFDGSDDEGWNYNSVKEKTVVFRMTNTTAIDNGILLSNKIMSNKDSSEDIENIKKSNKTLYIAINKSRLSEVSVSGFKEWLQSNPIEVQYQLATPTTETLTYIEGVTSQVGLTTQDTTSPSPTIPSDIVSVEKIETKFCGKNLADISNVQNWDNTIPYPYKEDDGYILTSGNKWRISSIPCKMKAGVTYTISFNEQFISESTAKVNVYLRETQQYFEKGKFTPKSDCDYINIYFNNHEQEGIRCKITELQVEVGDTATPYEPYKEQTLTLTPPFTFKSSLDGSVFDYVDVERGKYVQCLYEEEFDGSIDEGWSMASDSYANERYRSFFVRVKSIISTWNGNIGYIICDKLNNKKGESSIWNGVSEAISSDMNGKIFICLDVNRLESLDVQSFRKWLQENPLEVIYAIETPIEYDIPQEDLEKLRALQSYYDTTNIISNVPIKLDYKLNMPSWYKKVSGAVSDAREVIYDMQARQNEIEVQTLENAISLEYTTMMLEEGMM